MSLSKKSLVRQMSAPKKSHQANVCIKKSLIRHTSVSTKVSRNIGLLGHQKISPRTKASIDKYPLGQMPYLTGTNVSLNICPLREKLYLDIRLKFSCAELGPGQPRLVRNMFVILGPYLVLLVMWIIS